MLDVSAQTFAEAFRSLQTGAKILFDNAEESSSRCSLSTGTTLSESSRYMNSALVPREPWRPPTRDELTLLVASGRDAHRNNCVAIVELDMNITQPLRDFAASKSQFADRIEFQDRLVGASQNLLEELRVRFKCENPIFHGLAVHPKGLQTVTIEPKTNQFIGLHVDSWDGFGLTDRDRASNRISVNVGTTPRYFLFVNQTLTTIATALDRSGAAIQSLTPTEVGRTFMRRFPEYPVVRLQVNPGEAYIAPTENVIHDGSTAESGGTTKHVTLRGAFALNKCQQNYSV
jgi:hypothetical protein